MIYPIISSGSGVRSCRRLWYIGYMKDEVDPPAVVKHSNRMTAQIVLNTHP